MPVDETAVLQMGGRGGGKRTYPLNDIIPIRPGAFHGEDFMAN